MTMIAKKLRVGLAGCAIAAAASLTSVAPAEATPAPAPAAPMYLGPADVPQTWWLLPKLGHSDLLRGFKPFHGFIFPHHKIFKWGCYGHHGF